MRPSWSQTARSQNFATEPRSWLTRTIVFPRARKRSERREALLLELRVADGEHLVEQQDVEVDLDRDRVRKPHLHPRREVLQLLVDEALEPGELEDRVEALLELALRRGREACR